MDNLLDKYLDVYEKEEFLNIVKPIYEHIEFKKRDTNEFLHHSDITLSHHILEVALLTYKKGKKIKDNNFNLKTAILIAMMHDLYTIPWQNNNESKVHHFTNKHGFRHPLEAVINTINWFPSIYEENDSEIIIDSILHHMYPLGVKIFNTNIGNLELKNYSLVNNLNKKYINIIIKSTSRGKFFSISISKPKYKEGKLVSRCDKIISRHQIKNFHSLTSLVSGKNKSIK